MLSRVLGSASIIAPSESPHPIAAFGFEFRIATASAAALGSRVHRNNSAGAHYEVVDKVVTQTTIPSNCDTCHTFPQLTGPEAPPEAQKISAIMEPVPLGPRPADHNTGLFAFDHAGKTTSLNGIGTSCAACHQPSYCEDCHASGAINVHHDEMLYNHAASMRLANGPKACAVCHQPEYCAQCHKGDTRLGMSNSRLDRSTPEVGR